MNANEQVTRPGLTWTKLWLWMIVLYILGLIGFFAKASKQFPGLQFENAWQAVAVAFLPAIPFVIFAAPFLIWLAIKSFRIGRCGGLAQLIGVVYVVWIFFQLISPRPL